MLERPRTHRKPWISDETWQKVEERRLAKQDLNQAKTHQQKQQATARYSTLAKEVKRELRADKRKHINNIAAEAEEAASKGDLKTVYATTRLLSGRRNNPNRPVRDKEGKLLTTIEDQLARWKEHFQEVLNRAPPDERPQLAPGDPLDINTREISKTEIRKALSSLKNGRAAGTDNIPPEALREGGKGIVDQLYHLFNLIWTTEEMPTEWKKGLLVKLPKHGDLSQCGKWRGITLLSIPSKVFTRVILDRMKDALDKKLRDEQAGFRKERSCTDQIATLRVIVEQSLEWQSPLYACFIDFEKAFDSVDRQAIWNILLHYGIPPKFIDIIRRLYEGFTCQVIHSGRLSDSLRSLRVSSSSFRCLFIYTKRPVRLKNVAVICRASTGPYSFSSRGKGFGHISSLSCLKALQSCRMWQVSCSASPHEHMGEDTTFIFLCRCWFSLQWPVLNRKMVTWSCLVRLW